MRHELFLFYASGYLAGKEFKEAFFAKGRIMGTQLDHGLCLADRTFHVKLQG